MSHRDSRSSTPVTKKEGTEGESASTEETVVTRHDAQPPDGEHVRSAVAAPTVAPTEPVSGHDKTSKDGGHGSSHVLSIGLSDASLHSLGLTAQTTSSVKQQQSGTLPPSPVSSKTHPGLVTEASQTPDSSMGAYRSLTLQFSPRRNRQTESKSKQGSSTSSKPNFSDDSRVALSPKSIDSELGSPVSSGETFSLPAANRSSATLPSTGAGAERVLPPFPPKQVRSEGIIRSSTPASPAENTRSLAMQVSSERLTPAQAHPSQSPRSLVPWIEAAIKGVSSAVRSPRSLLALGSFTGSHQSPDLGFTSSHSKLEETTQSEDILATPHLPWATLMFMCLLVHAHWRFMHKHYPERCASVDAIVKYGYWERLVLAAFHHSNLRHLASNIVSFFFKALILEAALGAPYFSAVMTIVTVMVGVINVWILAGVYIVTHQSFVAAMCTQTLAGVITALGVFNREHFGKATVHYSEYELSMRYQIPVPVDMVLLSVSSSTNILPMVSGLLAGLLLAKTAVGKRVVGRHLYLASVPKTPVTYLFVAAVAYARLYGPFAEAVGLDATKLVYKHPVSQPFVLSPLLYVGNVFKLVYILLSVLAVGQRLEQHLGHCRFLVMAPALLLAVNLLEDGLGFVLWKHQLAFQSHLPPPGPHVGDRSCDFIGAILAMKAVLHSMRPNSEYQLASLPIGVHFWPGLVLELTHLHYFVQGGSTVAHVAGVLFGLSVAYFLRPRRRFCWCRIPGVTRCSTDPSSCQDYLEESGLSFH